MEGRAEIVRSSGSEEKATFSALGNTTLHLPRRAMMLFPSLALLLTAVGLASAEDAPQVQLANLASSSPNGVISLDAKTYDLITSPGRNWSAAIQFTAMDAKRRCSPCKYVGEYTR